MKKTTTAITTKPRRTSSKVSARAERYRVARDEVRLVQTYRGLAPEAQQVLLGTASALLRARPKGGAR
jgi:hypothetical protein